MKGVPAVEFKGVSKDYGSGPVVNNLQLDIPSGQIVTLIGPSGSGKTTILKMINRLIEPDSGTIQLEGKDGSKINPVELRRNIGYVIQQIGLFPHMTIEDNITVVPRLKGEKKKSLIGRTEELLQLIGLDYQSFRRRYPHELSGGQQQRIGVARALAAEPAIILMDEPFSALDPISREQLQNELMRLNQTVKKTIVFVTHDINEALKIADTIILLKEGKLVQVGTPEQLLKYPANDFVRMFIGEERIRRAAVEQSFQITAKLMTSTLSVASDLPLSETVERMKQFSSSYLAVTDKNSCFSGVITLTDADAIMKEDNDATIGLVLRKDFPIVMEETPMDEIYGMMINHPILPVVDDQHRYLGMITRDHVLRELAKQMKREGVLK
ncbi:betaine/proline/choline family ABC transporter ATP-binding protein [Bacillus sp. EB600]|uniref:betaine/proline/choline family ABC transporter ATP-binding protein n=1 Tax=Bacillus sp. EB600 TaxID=2806345 RepID=UPI00210BFF81|nr:betaine/proline/choline family ABC transporter ATP-binding protein [Bacillus sp. EB600]MCQ6279331.1 betaine/proline/choline family ABC transporter ATP-binding protein [Bacillus sp. EB600]